jgi:hypothetical protein
MADAKMPLKEAALVTCTEQNLSIRFSLEFYVPNNCHAAQVAQARTANEASVFAYVSEL